MTGPTSKEDARSSGNEHNEEMHFGHWMMICYGILIAFMAALFILTWVSG